MPTTTQTLCYNCFAQRESLEGPCPYCGFDLEENAKKFPVALRAGTVLNGRYIVGRVLGQGGFGITYLAFDTQLQAKVAVKEYMPNDIATRIEGTTVSVAMETRADDFTYGAERFQEEARTLAKFIGHPNIAGVSSYFDENDTSYFVMDYIEGISFKSYIANAGGRVSVDEALNVMVPVLRALTAVHAEGFIHRDVTPDNIYISKDGNVKLLDFGSARYSIGDKSKSLDVILKVGYAPKEQYIRRGRQGPYTDVYSCAACLYAALTGVLPPESLERLDHDELVPVSQAGIDIPDWLDRAILKGLAVQPEDRFQSAAEFLDAIENQIAVEVPVPSAPVQPEKKKPKTALIAGIAAALAVVLGVGIFLGSQGGGESAAPTPNNENVIAEDEPKDAPAQADDGLPPLKEAEVPSITIQGVEYSTDLRELDLCDFEDLTDEEIEPLCYMVNLLDLTLPWQSDIGDLSPLSGLTELRSLVMRRGSNSALNAIGYSSVKDFSPLTPLENLEKLVLYADAPQNLGPLRELPKLETLRLYLGTTPDLSPLSAMTQLRDLQVHGDQIPSLDWVSPLAGLQRLKLRGNPRFTDVNALSGLTELEELALMPYQYGQAYSYDIQGLSNLTSLRELQLEVGPNSLAPLENLTQLESLNICVIEEQVRAEQTDLTPLQNMKGLQSLTLWIQGIGGEGYTISLSPLAGLTEITDMKLRLDNQRAESTLDLTPLSGMTKMKNLSVTSHTTLRTGIPTIANLSALASMQELTELEIYCDDLTDISPLRELTKLKTVQIYNMGGTQIADLSPIDHVPNKTVSQ